MLTIRITLRAVYGKDVAYPACANAQAFAAIAGSKTLTRATLREVLALGYRIDVVDRYGQVCRSFQPGSSLPAMA